MFLKRLLKQNPFIKFYIEILFHQQFFQVEANTERYWKSSIPYMQKLLNNEDESVNKLLSQSSSNSKIFYASELCLQPADSITIDNLNYNICI